jgi:putative transposase
MACLDDDFEACIAHLRFPLGHRRAIRTTNLLERLFGEERRRTKVIPHAFGERAVLKLMYAALIRAAERWRGIRITEFELRQLNAIRGENAHCPVSERDGHRSPNPFIQQGPDLTPSDRTRT